MTGGSLHLERSTHPDFDMGIWGGGGAAIFPVYTVYGCRCSGGVLRIAYLSTYLIRYVKMFRVTPCAQMEQMFAISYLKEICHEFHKISSI